MNNNKNKSSHRKNKSSHRACDFTLVVIESNVEMADDVLLAVQEHFSKPHPDVKHCVCANQLRIARMLLREALEHARTFKGASK